MRTVFTNGSFDIIHAGHARLLGYCAALGDTVIVGVDSDKRYEETRGEPPILPFEQRKEIVEQLSGGTVYKITNTDQLIYYVKACDLYVKGGDSHSANEIQNLLSTIAGDKMIWFPADDKFIKWEDSSLIKSKITNRYRDKC